MVSVQNSRNERLHLGGARLVRMNTIEGSPKRGKRMIDFATSRTEYQDLRTLEP